MYAIGDIVYGVPWNNKLNALWNEIEENDPAWSKDEYEMFGFTTVYSGSSLEHVAYLGEVIDGMDVCANTRVADLKLVPTDEQKQKVTKTLAKLHPRVRKLCGEPEVWIIWGTS